MSWKLPHRKVKGKFMYESRFIMEQKLGRKLRKNEIVHHKNEDKFDNRINNLYVMTRSEHTKYHHIGVCMSEQSKNKMRKNFPDRKLSKNSNWKGGKTLSKKCGCGKQIDYRSTFCRSCKMKLVRNKKKWSTKKHKI